MKQWKMGIVGALMCTLLLTGCVSNDAANDVQDDTAESDWEQMLVDIGATASHTVTIEVQDYGTIEAELYENIAPITVANFVKLAEEGFYDGLTFHRVVSGFVIQGGDPLGNGTGGSDETIIGEFASNSVQNDLSHVRGVLSMARSRENDSASSQFFIVHEDATTALDGDYASFGMVTSGMDVVDAICEATPVEDNNGTVAPENQPVITSIRVQVIEDAAE